jgi:hypothetical protein
MSLIPSADAGAPSVNYFPAAQGGVMRAPTILPAEGNFGAAAARLTINNGVTDPSGDPMFVVHYVTGTSGGGLTAGHYQCFMYGPDVSGSNIGELFDAYGLGNNACAMSLNRAAPLDGARMGKITGTGALQAIAVPSITASSVVNLSFVGGTPAAGDVLYVIAANTSFSLTLPAGAVYNYEVIG